MTRRSAAVHARTGLFSIWLWWGALAAVCYLGLHEFSTNGLPHSTPEMIRSRMNQLAPLETWLNAAATAQYALPAACVAIALLLTLLGVIRNREVSARTGDAPGELGRLDNREFDLLLGEAFKLQGYQLVSSGGGVDMVLRKDHETCLVLAKQWKIDKVGVQPLRDLVALMGMRSAASGIVVTTGRFSREAVNYAGTHSLKLVEGASLLAMIRRAQSDQRAKAAAPPPPFVTASSMASKTVKTWPSSVPAALIPVADVLDDEEDYAAREHEAPQAPVTVELIEPPGAPPLPKRCPKCGAGMVLRKVRSGPKAGRSVWSCETYPACRGARRAS